MEELKKYNRQVPRYTSYPTVPFWNAENFDVDGYQKTLQSAFWESSKEVSLYIHLPFCESLCTYCACNTRITKNHAVEIPYLEHLLKEWDLYLNELPEKPIIRAIHLGGGTPTFFQPENLKRLLNGLIEKAILSDNVQMSFEGHPGNTTAEHLETLFDIGFDRVSFGIQDFDPEVQRLINRKQTFDQVKYITEKAREIGYQSVNFDVVHGLPGQTLTTIRRTIQNILFLRPDRIAFYNYAHVPDLKPAQKSYEKHLPDEDTRWGIYRQGREAFLGVGYKEVGMDHFVLPHDELLRAREEGDLHRNFMGYTSFVSKLLIGLGVSSISDTWAGFAQNVKSIPSYYQSVDEGKLPLERGHLHTKEDLFFRKHIMNLMCDFETSWHPDEFMEYGLQLNYHLLEELHLDGMIAYTENGMKVLPKGKNVIRTICSSMDAHLGSRKGKSPMSKVM